MADLSYDLNSSYVLGFNFVTSFKSALTKVFGKVEPVLLNEPVESITGDFTIIPKGLKSILACLARSDAATFTASSQSDLNDFHIVANCYDPTANDNYVGYYLGFCRLKEAPYSDLSDTTKPLTFRFSGGALKTALASFDAFNVAGTNIANQEVPFNFAPVLFEGNYAVSVFMDDTKIEKGTDYTEDATKVTILAAVPTTSKITVVNIYNP